MLVCLTFVAPACRSAEAQSQPASQPATGLHPQLQWLDDKKVRGIWIGGDLDMPYADSDRTVGSVLADAGFNLVVLYLGVDRKNRNTAPELVDRLTRNVAEARLRGLKVLAKWQYGSTHQEPYRKYREGGGTLHDRTCCPLDEDYVERHVGRWAVKAAQLGADGFVFDTEMYESDTTTYPGPCFCDNCFKQYLKDHTKNWQSQFDKIQPEQRGAWINDQDSTVIYAKYNTKRIEALYARLRVRCQAINPAFLFGYAPFFNSFAGLTGGLGTASNPCLVFSEQEYTSGPNPQSLANVQRIRSEGIPARYLSGLMVFQQAPDTFAKNALVGSLYGDGWWAWYGGALLNNPGLDKPIAFKSPYGRAKDTTAAQYHDALAAAHAKLDVLIGAKPDSWPKMKEVPPPPSIDVPRTDGKLTLDGKLTEPTWKNAAKFQLPTTRFGESTTVNTTVRLCWDDDALYVAYESQLQKGKAIFAPERGRDNTKMWQHDGVEIFVAPNRSTKRYAQFMVSAVADITDLIVDIDGGTGKYGSPSWNTDAQAGATNDQHGYIVEVRIPFADLDTPPKPGDAWGANFYRFIPDGAAWSPTYGGFHSPARFGTLNFKAQ
jgi:hypothetical protein